MRSLVLLDEQGVVVQQGLGLDLDRLRLAETLDPVVQGAPAATATEVGENGLVDGGVRVVQPGRVGPYRAGVRISGRLVPLELAYVEDWVYLAPVIQVKPVRQAIVVDLADSVRPDPSVVELRVVREGVGPRVHEHEISDSERGGCTPVLVSVVLLACACLRQAEVRVCPGTVLPREEVHDGRVLGLTLVVEGVRGARVEPVHEQVGAVASGGVGGVVVAELRVHQVVLPIRVQSSRVVPEVVEEGAVHDLSVAVGLRVVPAGEGQVSLELRAA